MTKMKKTGLGILIIVTALAISGITLAKTDLGPNHNGKPDLHKPIPATDVELVKKVTLRGKSAGKGKPTQQAATGILGEPVSGTKYAIVIGISDYPGTANDLYYADDDADEMNKSLREVYGFTNVTLLKDLDATHAAILTAITSIPSDAGEIVFFFSGHGGKGRADDGDKEAIDESIIVHDGFDLVYLWDGELKSAFAGFATSTRIVFIFDSCVAGGMTDLAAPGRIINMATTETGTAYEGIYGSEEKGNGQFTYYFVDEGMLWGFADLVGTPEVVTVEEAFDYAKTNCQLQIPTIKDSFLNDLLL